MGEGAGVADVRESPHPGPLPVGEGADMVDDKRRAAISGGHEDRPYLDGSSAGPGFGPPETSARLSRTMDGRRSPTSPQVH